MHFDSMNKIFLLLVIPLISNAQTEKLQPIGTIATYVIECPCKLFKYYDGGEMYYFCKDRKNNTEYTIKEFKHKDGLDVLLNTISTNLFRKKDSTIINKKITLLNDYLFYNPDGVIINFKEQKAVFTDYGNEKKIFFSDTDLLASYEITISSQSNDSLEYFFMRTVNSIIPKRKNIKTILGK